MRWFRLRLILLAALLALSGQGLLAFERAFHHHDEAPAGHKDGCTVCAAISEHGQPVDPPASVAAPVRTGLSIDHGRQLAAFIYAPSAIAPRGPPSTPAV